MAKRSAVGSNMTEGVIWRQLLRFFFPIMLGTLFQQLYNTVDAMVLGRFVGKEALAAVGGSAAQILNLLIGFFVGLSSGATVIISQHFGARDQEGVVRGVHTAMALAVAAGAAMTLVGLALAPALLRIMHTPEETMADSTAYLRVVFLAMIPSMVYNVGSGVLRAVGDSRRPLYFLIAACLVNVVLDVLFVIVFRMDVTGVAIATALAQLISAVLILRSLTHTGGPARLKLSEMRLDPQILRKTLRIGLPTGTQSVLYSLSNMIITTTINGFGTATVAAWVSLGKVDGMYWMINNAFGVSLMTFVGQNYGARRHDRIGRGMLTCGGMSCAAAWLFSLGFILLASPIFSLFTSESEVMELALQMVHSITPWYWLFVPIETISASLRGMGDTLFSTLITAVGICLFRVVWMLLVVPRWHVLQAVTVSYPISWVLTGVIFILYFISARRRLMLRGGF